MWFNRRCRPRTALTCDLRFEHTASSQSSVALGKQPLKPENMEYSRVIERMRGGERILETDPDFHGLCQEIEETRK